MQAQEQIVEDDLMLIRDREERIRQLEVIFHNCAICLAFCLISNLDIFFIDLTGDIISFNRLTDTENYQCD